MGTTQHVADAGTIGTWHACASIVKALLYVQVIMSRNVMPKLLLSTDTVKAFVVGICIPDCPVDMGQHHEPTVTSRSQHS